MGALIADVENELDRRLSLWEYRDTGPLADHHGVALVISLSAAPLFAMYFAQGLKRGEPIPWRRIGCITAIVMLPEVAGLYTGHIVHGRWWSTPISGLAYLPTWLSIWALHRRQEHG